MTFIKIYLLIGCLFVLVDYFCGIRKAKKMYSKGYDEAEYKRSYKIFMFMYFIIAYAIVIVLWPLAVTAGIILAIVQNNLKNKVNKARDESIVDKES